MTEERKHLLSNENNDPPYNDEQISYSLPNSNSSKSLSKTDEHRILSPSTTVSSGDQDGKTKAITLNPLNLPKSSPRKKRSRRGVMKNVTSESPVVRDEKKQDRISELIGISNLITSSSQNHSPKKRKNDSVYSIHESKSSNHYFNSFDLIGESEHQVIVTDEDRDTGMSGSFASMLVPVSGHSQQCINNQHGNMNHNSNNQYSQHSSRTGSFKRWSNARRSSIFRSKLTSSKRSLSIMSNTNSNATPISKSVNPSKTTACKWTFDDGEWHLQSSKGTAITLVHGRFEHVPMKDFHAEIRGGLDVRAFLSTAVVMLNVPDHTLDRLIGVLVDRIYQMARERDDTFDLTEVRNAFFVEHDVHMMKRWVQGVTHSENGWSYDHSWICIMSEAKSIQKRYVAIARMKKPVNLGKTCQDVVFIILVLTPVKEKETKNSLETARTFATIFSDMEIRNKLLQAVNAHEFAVIIGQNADRLGDLQSQQKHEEFVDQHSQINLSHLNELNTSSKDVEKTAEVVEPSNTFFKWCQRKRKKLVLRFEFFRTIGEGVRDDFHRRTKLYQSDYLDGLFGHRVLRKVSSTVLFLFFACLLPSIAFGVLNDTNTGGKIGVRKTILAQCIGGLTFSLFGGQPLMIIMTTLPLSIFIKIVTVICKDYHINFFAMYAMVGLWSSFFLIIFAVSNISNAVIKKTTRSLEEIFTAFVCIAFVVDAIRHIHTNFKQNYFSTTCATQDILIEESLERKSSEPPIIESAPCYRENSLLYLILTFGTTWFAIFLYNFKKTPFLNARKRELLTDFGLPISVLIMSYFGSDMFKAIKLKPFMHKETESEMFAFAPLLLLDTWAVLGSALLGFFLALLCFLDQTITNASVNSSVNRLKKGPAYHVDILVVAIINAFLSVFGLTWLHGASPHSVLHVKALADTEEKVDQGHVSSVIVYVRETRLTGLLSHILIGLSLLMLPKPLIKIPVAVLDGIFFYLAITGMDGSQIFDRTILIFMEQSAYPPNHYIRRVPQRKMHLFTFLQLIQLSVLSFVGLFPWPYLKISFPVVVALMIPFRFKLLPRLIDEKYLKALDPHL
ncbi:hypothetical protein SNEBB_011307 [Seison nebaliae]|nr:hypothetical protein SNEBB_011307 [Seison nebaliae]